ncbi:uncharacterized protein EV422DRAFT_572191 [Fimicolochytrium jonesii]|uniref:uncharacterized protein n=1 Tax=Fimicolochytrium jonesii TaxID=1396493 RepID=UPI0022FEA689|nr:uncharacterized protein EV422DRAFT_572191 [Fimicolochytrium jonesii]KAI8815993.1 hypothetical protein EV422DRAFT_572191 [Fimicolochytrium jonesii]
MDSADMDVVQYVDHFDHDDNLSDNLNENLSDNLNDNPSDAETLEASDLPISGSAASTATNCPALPPSAVLEPLITQVQGRPCCVVCHSKLANVSDLFRCRLCDVYLCNCHTPLRQDSTRLRVTHVVAHMRITGHMDLDWIPLTQTAVSMATRIQCQDHPHVTNPYSLFFDTHTRTMKCDSHAGNSACILSESNGVQWLGGPMGCQPIAKEPRSKAAVEELLHNYLLLSRNPTRLKEPQRVQALQVATEEAAADLLFHIRVVAYGNWDAFRLYQLSQLQRERMAGRREVSILNVRIAWERDSENVEWTVGTLTFPASAYSGSLTALREIDPERITCIRHHGGPGVGKTELIGCIIDTTINCPHLHDTVDNQSPQDGENGGHILVTSNSNAGVMVVLSKIIGSIGSEAIDLKSDIFRVQKSNFDRSSIRDEALLALNKGQAYQDILQQLIDNGKPFLLWTMRPYHALTS